VERGRTPLPGAAVEGRRGRHGPHHDAGGRSADVLAWRRSRCWVRRRCSWALAPQLCGVSARSTSNAWVWSSRQRATASSSAGEASSTSGGGRGELVSRGGAVRGQWGPPFGLRPSVVGRDWSHREPRGRVRATCLRPGPHPFLGFRYWKRSGWLPGRFSRLGSLDLRNQRWLGAESRRP
jgi:hypothetical protein